MSVHERTRCILILKQQVPGIRYCFSVLILTSEREYDAAARDITIIKKIYRIKICIYIFISISREIFNIFSFCALCFSVVMKTHSRSPHHTRRPIF